MRRHKSFIRVNESREYYKNEMRLKSPINRMIHQKLLFIIITLCCLLACNKDGIESTDNSAILKDAIFLTDETDFKEGLITYTNENSEEVSLFALEGLIVIYFQDDINLKSATQIITELNGTIVERIPAINYYVVKVAKGSEAGFIHAIQQKQETEYVIPYLLSDNCGEDDNTAIMDRFGANDAHGAAVLDAFNECGCHSGTVARIDVGGILTDEIDLQKALNAIYMDIDVSTGKARWINRNLINMSFSTKRCNKKGQCISNASYYAALKKRIKQIIIRIEKMKKFRDDNIVITIAAGNEGMPLYRDVFVPLVNELSLQQQAILKKNILIVGTPNISYSNTSTKNNAFAMVDISDLSSSGTSIAAPRALCYISRIMNLGRNGKRLTAVEALELAKTVIAKNSMGKFVLEEVLAESGYKIGAEYGGGIIYYIDNKNKIIYIAALNDLSPDHGYAWYSPDRDEKGNIIEAVENWPLIGAKGEDIGTGKSNTNIIRGRGSKFIAANFSSGEWYLPSKNELEQLRYARINYHLGGIQVAGPYGYWSSTEYNFRDAYAVDFGSDWTIGTRKSDTYRVHLIKSVSYKDCN